MKKPLIVAEIGINHNGDLTIAKSLISLAHNFGADYVKFQKRTPNLCVPTAVKDTIVSTVFGHQMKYIDYKNKMEFTEGQYKEIDEYCLTQNIKWFASVWDVPSVEFVKKFNHPFIKIPSAVVTNNSVLRACRDTKIPCILSTGMSTREEIDSAVDVLGGNLEYILHTTSSYPTPNNEMNMNKITTLKHLYGDRFKIGFSNHSSDIIYLLQAYIMGAELLEFHITLDRNMLGTDQLASIGPTGFDRIVKHVNNIERGFGDGELKVQNSELSVIKKLRCL